ncbi:MAG: hypothetical protein Unbinned3849contig1000_44 [Prokaryotic dsDNA virus sp.]|mgnify:CR=1 FL=1|nr:MAG: hypothetical protein Unbinned3849contig1000_44 [Prokaryotic dsDNA virus sp.]|tara:strand:+ start:508 stop:825 length:318 start_codon:yes stop_codon:yes gene_type:complete
MGKYWFANNPDGRLLAGSATVDFAEVTDGNEVASDITVAGAALGDIVMVSHSLDVQDLQLTADVTAANTVSVVASSSGDTVDMASGTVRVLVIPSASIDKIIAGM